MGIYLNPSNESLRLTLASGTYVNKTMMIAEINRSIDTGNSYVCVSRPRRFGKTIAGSMLCAYYSKGCDEYDVLVREQVNEALFAEYLDLLNGLFKNNTLRPAIVLAYLTGILPIVKDIIESKLNNFRQYTILDARELAE